MRATNYKRLVIEAAAGEVFRNHNFINAMFTVNHSFNIEFDY